MVLYLQLYGQILVRKTRMGKHRAPLHLIAALLVAAAIISFVLSALGFVLAGAFKLLPGVLLVLTIIFFAQGGHVDIRLPEKWKRK